MKTRVKDMRWHGPLQRVRVVMNARLLEVRAKGVLCVESCRWLTWRPGRTFRSILKESLEG